MKWQQGLSWTGLGVRTKKPASHLSLSWFDGLKCSQQAGCTRLLSCKISLTDRQPPTQPNPESISLHALFLYKSVIPLFIGKFLFDDLISSLAHLQQLTVSIIVASLNWTLCIWEGNFPTNCSSQQLQKESSGICQIYYLVVGNP